MATSTRDDGDTAGVILKINFKNLELDPDNYLNDIRSWKTWRTRTPIHAKCDKSGWKLILYDPVEKAITGEFEIQRTIRDPDPDHSDWIWRHDIKRRTFERHHIELERIERFFPKFAKGPNPYWYLTHRQYKRLTRNLAVEFFEWLVAFDEEWMDEITPQMLKKWLGRIPLTTDETQKLTKERIAPIDHLGVEDTIGTVSDFSRSLRHARELRKDIDSKENEPVGLP